MTARRGRPQFKVTPALRRTVEQLVSVGESHDSIARAIGCSRETLEKHFKEELATGYSKRRREVVDLLYKSARSGNVSAIKKLEDMTKVGGAADHFGSQQEPDEGGSAPAAAVGPVGKKEQRAEAAKAAGVGRYATPEPPKLVVDNR